MFWRNFGFLPQKKSKELVKKPPAKKLESIQKIFNDLLDMCADERKTAVRNLTVEQRQSILAMMALPKSTSQKGLCSEIEKTTQFVRAAKSSK